MRPEADGPLRVVPPRPLASAPPTPEIFHAAVRTPVRFLPPSAGSPNLRTAAPLHPPTHAHRIRREIPRLPRGANAAPAAAECLSQHRGDGGVIDVALAGVGEIDDVRRTILEQVGQPHGSLGNAAHQAQIGQAEEVDRLDAEHTSGLPGLGFAQRAGIVRVELLQPPSPEVRTATRTWSPRIRCSRMAPPQPIDSSSG
jgi:hypothetical protein